MITPLVFLRQKMLIFPVETLSNGSDQLAFWQIVIVTNESVSPERSIRESGRRALPSS